MKGFPKLHVVPENLAAAIVDVHAKKIHARSAGFKYGVSHRSISTALEKLNETIQKTGIVESSTQKQITRWATKYAFDYVNLPVPKKMQYIHTEWEWKMAAYKRQIGEINDWEMLVHTFGVSQRSVQRLLSKCYNHFGEKSAVKLKKVCAKNEDIKQQVRKFIFSQQAPKKGRSYLTETEETVIVAKAEMEAAHANGKNIHQLAKTLSLAMNVAKPGLERSHKSNLRYAYRVLKRVNENAAEAPGQSKRSRKGTIKVGGLSHKRCKQSDPRLGWIMFHKICETYREIKKAEAESAMVSCNSELTSNEKNKKEKDIICESKKIIKVKQEVSKDEAAKSLNDLMVLPDDLDNIQLRPSQVWNCDEIGFDPNGKWYKIINTYKWCNTDQVWKARAGERAEYWCTLLIFTRADGQCFFPPVVVHKQAVQTGDLHLNLPEDWLVCNTPSGYMDRDSWRLAIRYFAQKCGATALDRVLLFFDGHDSHWDPGAMEIMEANHINAFILKVADSENDQPNDNGANAKLHSCYNHQKAEWGEKFINVKYTPAHLNSVLTQTWRKFQRDSAATIIDSFKKTRLLPLKPPATGAVDNDSSVCIAALQCGTGKKATELSVLAEKIMKPVQYTTKTTTDKTVILRAKKNENNNNKHETNLLIRGFVWDIVQKTTVLPAQQLKDIEMEICEAKSVRLTQDENDTGNNKESLMNPDSSCGVRVTALVRAETKRIHDGRIKKKEEKKKKEEATAKKKEQQAVSRAEVCAKLIAAAEGAVAAATTPMDLRTFLNSKHTYVADLVASYQHLGGDTKSLPNTRKATVAEALVNEFADHFKSDANVNVNEAAVGASDASH